MRIALINTNRKTNIYPIALLKLGAWLKSKGNYCQLFNNVLPRQDEFDAIWFTTVFTFDIFYVRSMIKKAKTLTKKIKIGGVSASLFPDVFRKLDIDVHVGLHYEAEHFSPDYSLLKDTPNYSIIHTTRGCIRKCKFCMVPLIEPIFLEKQWEKDLSPNAHKIVFYDNNWLAKNKKSLYNDIALLHSLTKNKKISSFDFNQGIDARLITDEIGAKLQGLPFKPVRFSFDGMHEDGYYQKAIAIMVKNGFKNFSTNVLYNFTDTPQDFYYRLKESIRLQEKFNVKIISYPLRYQPVLKIDLKRQYVGKSWTTKYKRAFMELLCKQSVNGQISSNNLAEFEYWFGKNKEQFIKILSYPNIAILAKRKRAYIRIHPEIRKNITKQ